MKYPVSPVTPVRSDILILTGGVKEDVSQLELAGGELLQGINYQEIDGAYHGYSSIPGYERFDGQELASSIGIDLLNDYGDDSQTVLLFESDMKDTITDISISKHSTVNTGVLNDPTHSKFFSSSFYFDGSSKLTITPIGSLLDLTDQDFTIDTLIGISDQVSTQGIFVKELSYKLEIINHRLVFSYSVDGVTWEVPLVSNQYLGTSSEMHIAVSRKGENLYMFFNGVRDFHTLNIGSDSFFTNTNDLEIGVDYIGYMDEMRISNGLRWLIDFTIPVLPYSQAGYYTYQIDDTAREAQRDLIQPVPGAGPVLGITTNATGGVGAIRDNATGTAGYIYRADPTGWSAALPGVFYGNYENGLDTDSSYPGFQVGDTVTGSISGATATIILVSTESGSWEDYPSARDAAGVIVIKDVVGVFDDSDELSNGGTCTADVIPATFREYALAPGGTYEFIEARFDLLRDLQRKSVPFFANNVNYPTYFDGTQLIPIVHTNLPDSQGVFANHLVEFKNRLFLAYPDGRLWYSGVGNPLDYDTATGGAGEIYLEDEITSLQVGQGDVLIVFCRNSIQIIKSIVDTQVSGTTQADYAFFNQTFSNVSGAIAGTTDRILGEILYLDDRGVTKLSATDAYGDFSAASISKNVQRTVLEKKGIVVSSAVHRQNNQYRLFFNDKTGLIFTFDTEKRVKGVTMLKYNHQLTCFTEGEDFYGNLRLFFGADDGYVYRMDSGTSFDGDVIKTKMATAFYSYKSPTNWKLFHKATLETQADRDISFFGGPEFNYRNSNIPKSNTAKYTSTGFGGAWGVDAWGLFSYGSQEIQSPALYLSGYGNNMSMVITTAEKYASPHVLNSLVVEYAIVGRRM